MHPENKIGVVTVTFNSAGVIDDFMTSLLGQSCAQFVLYVIDNASSDATVARLSRYDDPRIVVVRNRENVGIAEGNNIGIRAALKDGCESILLINNDTAFDKALISSLQRGLSDHNCDLIAPKILYFDQPEKIWAAGGYFSKAWGSSRHFGIGQEDKGQFDRLRAVAFGPACCLLIKSDVFKKIGLMDPAYFVYFDDTDFCYRAHRSGIRLVYLPSARLLHKVSSLTGGRESDFSLRYYSRNEIYFLLKSLPWWKLCFYLPMVQVRVLARQLLSGRSWVTLWKIQRSLWEGVKHYRQHKSNSAACSGSLTVQDAQVSISRLRT
jgi:hypothetical protein